MRSSLTGFEDLYRAVSRDIFKFARLFNFEPTWQQAQLLQAIQDADQCKGPRQIAVASGQGPGKTAATVIGLLWRTFIAVNSLTVATAPTMRQLREILLIEATLWVEKADPVIQRLINVTKSGIEFGGKSSWGVELVTATKVENAQGYHRANMTVVGEEASGIPREIVTQFKGTLSNENALFVLIGNPNTRDCAFFDCFTTQRHEWATFRWDAEDTARDYPWLLDPERNRKLADEFGEDSDVYRVRVKGLFPRTDPNCVMSSEDVEEVCCPMDSSRIVEMAKIPRLVKHGGGLAKQFGIDLARFGGDESTIYRRSGMAIVDWHRFSHTEPSDVLDRAFTMQLLAQWRNQDCQYVCDAGGIGQGIMHKFYHANKRILEFHNNGVAAETQIYDNRITEAWFGLAEKVKSRQLALPKDQQLVQQLANRQYYQTKKGKIVLESKDDYMKRGFNSPDRADGVVYAMYDAANAVGGVVTVDGGSAPAGVIVRGQR